MEVQQIPVRDVRTGVETVPKAWHAAGRAVTFFFDNLSLLFPEGERFFMRSVRRCASAVSDPDLAHAVRSFVGQEAMHTREHERYNAMLRGHGHPVDRLERRVKWLLARGRRLPPRVQLAITVALEHYTAHLGRIVLSDPRVLEGAHPEMAKLWRWHALEEVEHKRVAHEVFEAAGGTYLERLAGMAIAAPFFWCVLLWNQLAMMRADGCAGDMREWRALLRYLFVDPGGMARVLSGTIGYLRPGHRPSDVDDAPLVETWRAAF